MDESPKVPSPQLSEDSLDESGRPKSAVSRRDLLRLTLGGGAGLAAFWAKTA